MKFLLLLIIIAILFIIDLYAFKTIKYSFDLTFLKLKIFTFIYWGISFAILAFTFYVFIFLKQAIGSLIVSFLLTSIILLYIPKLNIVSMHLIEEFISFFFVRYIIISKIGVALSLLSFIIILHGITINKHNFKLIKQEIFFSNLPNKFDGFKIIQISDIHIGSYLKSTNAIKKAVSIINKEKPDLAVMTGDMVNILAKELNGFESDLKDIRSKYGVYSILGNHDYGDYNKWDSKEARDNNIKQLILKHQEIGFQLLMNKSNKINIGNHSIVIAGVENWGKPPFPQYGDIKQTLNNISENDFVVLLSHDPSHWREQILDNKTIDLTLSGHTHAMQAGIEIGNFKWSPVSFKYKEWAGIYNQGKQYLYVNRGLGYIGLLGRIGIRPEITEIILRQTD